MNGTPIRARCALHAVMVSSNEKASSLVSGTRDLAPLLLKLPHTKKLIPAAPHQFVGLVATQVFQLADQRVVDCLSRLLVVRVRSARRLRDDLVDHPQVEQLLGRDTKRARRLFTHFLAFSVFP